jgi:4-methyl-5(b-hydroxyethyl)-thiazole monophosphate biosynthesis
MKRIALVLAPGFEEFESSCFLSVLGATRLVEGVEPLIVETVALEREVSGAHGFTVRVTHRSADADPTSFAAAAIPGGFHEKGYSHATDPPILEFLRAIDKKGGLLASSSTGSRVFAAAGLLVGKRATTFPFADGRHRAFLAECGATLHDEPIVRDGNLITGRSPWDALDTAFQLLFALLGERAVAAVRRSMGAPQ